MEAIVLALTPQTTAAKVSQTDSSTGESASPFAPHLNQAISEKQGKADNAQASDLAADSGQSQAAPHSPSVPVSLTDSGDQDQIDSAPVVDQSVPAHLAVIGLLLDIGQTGVESSNGAETAANTATNPLFAQLTAALNIGSTTVGSTTENSASPLTAALTEQPEISAASGTTQPEILKFGGATTQALPTVNASAKQDISPLLSQLQDIINANETQKIVIRQQPQAGITLNELADLTQQPATVTAGTVSIAAAGNMVGKNLSLPDMTAEPVSSKVLSLRQEFQQQYLEGKINLGENQTGKNGGNQANLQDSANGGQTAQGMPGLSSTLGEQTAEPVIFNLPSQETSASQQVSQQGKVYNLASGTMVAEQDVLNQVLQRFQLTNRDQSTQINLKLHPAELGELQVHLSIKEGTIKASVIAQNQNVQEILEKNMAKLKTVLEQQGFIVEDIIVSAKSENVGNFDFFGEQLPNRQNFTFSDNRPDSAATFEAALDNSMIQATNPEAGVNIRA